MFEKVLGGSLSFKKGVVLVGKGFHGASYNQIVIYLFL